MFYYICPMNLAIGLKILEQKIILWQHLRKDLTRKPALHQTLKGVLCHWIKCRLKLIAPQKFFKLLRL